VDGIVVNRFTGVIPPYAHHPMVNVSLIVGAASIDLGHFHPFMNGLLWATNTETDIMIHYRGDLKTFPSPQLNIRIDMR
jgi:hypothetical protein